MSLLLEQLPAFCIQVLKHRGRTDGQGASGTGVPGGGALTVVEADVTPPVGPFGTHLPYLSSSPSLQLGGAEVVVETDVVVEVRIVDPPVGG